jgi:hypothetical protein
MSGRRNCNMQSDCDSGQDSSGDETALPVELGSKVANVRGTKLQHAVGLVYSGAGSFATLSTSVVNWIRTKGELR